jgi:IS5 family transposase
MGIESNITPEVHMVRRPTQQVSLADYVVYARVPHNNTLDRLNALIDWQPLQKRMEALYDDGGLGRPGWPVLVLFKALLLQTWYNLSDPATEEALADRLSFRRFAGLPLEEAVPDHSTLHRFRDRIEAIMEELFDWVDQQLQTQGLILKRGTLVDATLILSAARPPAPGQGSADGDATWAKKNGHSSYGSKGHLGVDQGSQLIRKADLTTAQPHDSHGLPRVICGDEEAVCADKAYFSQISFLEALGIAPLIMLQARKNHPLSPEAVAFNAAVGRIRRAIEKVFGTLKRHYGWGRCRYYSLKRNRVRFRIACLGYNLKRVLRLQTI